ncbi:unnamed protein product [Chrysoparadoxa australica]
MRIFALFCLFFSLSLGSQVDPESRKIAAQLKKELDFQIEFTSLILRVGNQIYRDISGSNKPATYQQVIKLEHGKLEEILKARVMEFAEFYEKQITLPAEKKGLFRKLFPLFQWSNLADMLKQSMVGFSGFFKQKGIGVALGIGLGLVTEWSSYIILYASGLPELIPIAMTIPYGTTFTAIPTVFNHMKLRNRMRKVLGGKIPYKAYFKQRKESLKRLKMKSPDQILFPLSHLPTFNDGTVNALVLSKNTWIDSFLLKIGMNPKRLSYPTLKLFTIMNGIDSPAIKWVRDQEGIPLYLKTALITDLIMKSEDEAIKNKFKARFANNFVELNRAPYWANLKDWTLKVMEARKIEQILELMAQIPQGVAPEQIMELWEKIILPHYATEFDMGYASYRRLKEEITLLKAYVQGNPSPNWNSQFYREFATRMSTALKVSIPTCKSPETTILKYLLKLK